MTNVLPVFSAEPLYVIANCFNPESSEIRYKLHKDFRKYMSQFPNVQLIEIELVIGDQAFRVTRPNNPNHIQLRTHDILWFKENLNNIVFRHIPRLVRFIENGILVTRPAKVAWIDADVASSNKNWINDTLRLLNEFKFVQMFEQCDSLGPKGEVIQSDPSFVYVWRRDGVSPAKKPGRSGGAWAAGIDTLENIGYLIDWDITGASDWFAAWALTNQTPKTTTPCKAKNDKWALCVRDVVNASVGCVEGILYHFFHGWPSDRGYETRGKILINNEFDPDSDIIYRKDGLLAYNPAKPKPRLQQQMKDYFKARNEHGVLEEQEEILHVVTCVFSPSSFASRYNRYNQFAEYISQFKHVRLWTVELIFPGQNFTVTDANNPYHLQLTAEHPLWYKENILNILIDRLPPEAKNIAVVDGDVQWKQSDWDRQTIKALKQYPVVQMLATWQNLDENDKPTMPPARGFAQRYVHGTQKDGDTGFTGLAWAWRRETLEQLGGLFDKGILGSGDYFMANALIGKNRSDAGVIDTEREPDLKNWVALLDAALDLWIVKAETAVKRNLGYVNLHILHFFHGKKANRGYNWRWRILAKFGYDPLKHVTYDSKGLIVLKDISVGIFSAIRGYFDSRRETDRTEGLEVKKIPELT